MTNLVHDVDDVSAGAGKGADSLALNKSPQSTSAT